MKKYKIMLFCLCMGMWLGGCKRYEFTEGSYTTNKDINSLLVEELDTPIMIEFSSELEETLRADYFESEQETYKFKYNDGTLKIKKHDKANGVGFYLFGDDSSEQLVLKIKISKKYLDHITIKAKESAVKVVGGEIGELEIRTTYDPIELEQVAIKGRLIANTKYDSIKAAILGSPEDFSVKANAEGGNNSLQNHVYDGEKVLELDTKEGDIDVKFVDE